MPVRDLPEGCEWRGFKFRVYPTTEQVEEIRLAQSRLRRIWNALVADARSVYQAREAAAIRHGVVDPYVKPDYTGLEPMEAKALAAESAEMSKKRRAAISAWAKGKPSLAYRSRKEAKEHFLVKHDYQWAMKMAGVEAPTMLVQSLCKDYDFALAATTRGQRPPRSKKRDEDMGLRTRTGTCLFFGAFGTRPGCEANGRTDFLNCQIKLPGISRIAGRIGAEQIERLSDVRLEGVSLREEPDGWYASIRHAQTPKTVPRPTVAACGIDMGLIDLAAIVGTDGQATVIANPRSSQNHARHIAARQSKDLPVGKLHCRAARNMRQIVRERLFPVVDTYEFIFVERLPRRIGQMGSPHVSFMRTAVRMLEQRYGDRVKEVEPAYTSQDCSQCGFRSKEAWSCANGRKGKCPQCGNTEHRDLNAARNVLHKGLESLASEELE